jgi:23S rRNA pseudouridine2605 synthase
VTTEYQNDTIRMDSLIAKAGLCARRKVGDFLQKHSVMVNNEIALSSGQRVTLPAQIIVDGQAISTIAKFQYIALNKPSGYLCSASDPEGRALACDLLPHQAGLRLYNVGRLDCWSEGLLLFTNDGEFAAKVMHPSRAIEKEYWIRTRQYIDERFLTQFKNGLTVEGVFYQAKNFYLFSNYEVSITLIEGKNREIRRVFASWRLDILQLFRTRIGEVRLGDLPVGQWRQLTEKEHLSLI